MLPGSLRIVLLLLLGVASPGNARAQTVVRLLHHNIHREIGNDVAPGGAAQVALGKIVNYLAPDVWTINELAVSNGSGTDFAAAHDALAAFINTYVTVFGPAPVENQNYFTYLVQRTDGFITSAVVSRYPFLSTQTYSDAGAGYPALRGLGRAQIDLPGAVEMSAFTAHLKALNSTASAQKRMSEATANAVTLGAWLAAHPEEGVVMTGDFNESEEPGDGDNWSGGVIGDAMTMPDSSVQIYRPITTLRGAGLEDAKPASIAGNRDTIDATSPDIRFDYILHRASHLIFLSGQVFDTKQHSAAQLSALNAANGTAFVTADSAMASDHLPVLEVFLVSPGAPYIFSQSAGIDSTTATLNAGINPNGFTTTWSVELGTTTAYGMTSFAQTIAAGTTNVNAVLNVAGLAPGTTYHFRVVAQNGSGTSAGADRTFTTAAFLDSDADGIPNGWETANALNPNLAADALLDADGDGVSNRDEYAAGTNPRNAASALRIAAVARLGADVAVSWPSVFGKRYQVQTRADLIGGAWGVLQTNIVGTGAMLSVTDPAVAPRFYRIVTLP